MISNSTRRPLPGRQPLSREFIAHHQRTRIVAALATEVSERGYQTVTVADVVKRARIARSTFYENFSSKAECFLTAQEFAMSAALKRVIEAAGQADDWPRRVAAGLTAFLDYVVEEPELARTCMVEALAAGPASIGYYEESLQSFISLFRLGRDVSSHGGDLPETIEEAIIGGVFWIVYQGLTRSPAQDLEEILPEIVEFALTPYIGAEAARELSAVKKLAN